MGQIPKLIHKSWHPYIEELFDDEKLIELNTKILPTISYYPPRENIFTVFQMPLDKIKVVILGTDPHPNFAQANGLAFGVNKHIKMPKTTESIYRELNSAYREDPAAEFRDPREWKTLVHWFHQGVFLLNTALTVEAMKPASHTRYWESFTENIVSIIASKNSPVWLLWGNEARSYKKIIEDSELFQVNDILEARHPNSNEFSGCNHFLKTNEILLAKGQTAINW